MSYIIGLLCLFSFITSAYASENISVGFIYKHPPEEAFYLYDWLVVDPDSFSWEKMDEKFYIKKRPKLIAYLSLSEVNPHRSYYKKIKKDWVIGQNKEWKSYITDIRNKEYQDFLLNEVVPSLNRFQGIFFDTIDSYQIVLKPEEFKSYEEAQVQFFKRFKSMYPDKIIIINRGFEILDRLSGVVNGVVAESLFYGIDSGSMKYEKMKEDDTAWLLNKLKQVKSLGYKVIVIDYVDPKNRKLALEVAKNIHQNGFIPYVTDIHLQTLGTSLYQIIPRKVLMLYRKKEEDPTYSDLSRIYQVWLEYLGFVPVFYDIDSGLPKDFLADEYVGILSGVDKVEDEMEFGRWVKSQISKGIKVFFIENIPLPKNVLSDLGIDVVGNLSMFDNPTLKNSHYDYFETEPMVESIPMLKVKNGKVFLKGMLKGKDFDIFAVTDWGGFALPGGFVRNLADTSLFVFNPIDVFREVFKPTIPALDVTTENGRRILTAHIDGDAAFGDADFNPSKNVTEIIRDEIIKVYDIPHTVSFIEGEISPEGLYPEKSKKLLEIIKSVYSLPNVEAASHSFSHPFRWRTIEEIGKSELEEGAKREGYNLNIKGYKFSLDRDIAGSVEFINKNLLDNKKKVKVFLWTGDCIPSENALKITYKLGIYNVNGGNTVIDKQNPFFSNIGPMGINKGDYFQVFAPIQNENVFTNLWKDYYGYIKVIDTFKLTDDRYRLKPVAIYYHFYSGQKLSSLKALKDVYSYALSLEVNPMYLSEYAQKVLEYRNTVLAHNLDGELVIRGEGGLRTVRYDYDADIDIDKSIGVVGYKKIKNSTYLHLDGSGFYKIVAANHKPSFMLVDSNGQIESFKKGDDVYHLRLKSNIPLELKVYADHRCKILVRGRDYNLKINGKIYEYTFKREKEGYVEANCSS